MPERAVARQKLGLPADAFIVATSGFATRAKRFDWMMEALEQVLAEGVELIWIHAGEERPHEYDVSSQLERYPLLRERTRITGYVDEDALNAYISACDLLLNLRFPSVGESSGTLARALAAGRCCVVSDTAAYRELPREAVVHLPVLDQVRSLACAVSALHRDRELLHAFGANARRYAETELNIASVARRYRDVIEESQGRAVARPGLLPPRAKTNSVLVLDGGADLSPQRLAAALGEVTGSCSLLLKFSSMQEIIASSLGDAPLLARLLPEHVALADVRILAPEDAANSNDPSQDVLPPELAGRGGILLRLEVAGSAA
nr:glycosyltransferase family 4 protein [Pseudoroseomonas coralli]